MFPDEQQEQAIQGEVEKARQSVRGLVTRLEEIDQQLGAQPEQVRSETLLNLRTELDNAASSLGAAQTLMGARRRRF